MHARHLARAADGANAQVQRQKALRMIYDLKFTFGMDDLARVFLQRYAIVHPPATDTQITNRRG